MKKLFLIMFAVLFSTSAFAGGWSNLLTVERVFTEGKTDLIVIYTSGGIQRTDGCIANTWIFEADNESRRNRAYSTAMAAIASGKKISFWYADTCSARNYHGATSIQLHK